MNKVILGINSAYHESSACLIIDGKLIAAIEEERLSRIKHAKEAKIDNPDELPYLAINKCLEMGYITLSDVDEIGFSFDPEKRFIKNLEINDACKKGSWGSEEGEKIFYERLQKVPEKLRALGFKGTFKFMEHALAHAASAYYPSGFNDAAILSIDGIGEFESATLAHGKGKDITTVAQIVYPDSIGFLWEKIAKFLGYSEYDACKIMSIASFGSPEKYMGAFRKIVTIENEEFFSVDKDVAIFRVEDYSKLEDIFGIKKREFDDPLLDVHKDIAASLQEVTTIILMKIINRLAEETKSKNLCLAGGVALNCVTNRIIFENSSFEQVYIQPAANDAGTALGAALRLYEESGSGERIKMDHTYLGPSFSNASIGELIKSRDLICSEHEGIEMKVAKLIAEGYIVGWFQGAMEFGPRALGNRSLLADPRDHNMIKKLNSVVKHREDHRPFCPSVLCEDAQEWFLINKPAVAADFMLMAYPVVQTKKDNIPAVVHVDNTSRIQIVRKTTNPKYHRLISCFKEITGVPLLLNTSFNDREPIVCTPNDAINTFLRTKIDYLVLGDFLLNRKENLEHAKAKKEAKLMGV